MAAQGRSTATSYLLAFGLFLVLIWCAFYAATLAITLGTDYTGSVSPLTGLHWALTGSLSANQFNRYLLIAGGGLIASCVVFIVVYQRLRSVRPVKDMHGTARFAKKAEIERSGLLGGEGVFVGGFSDGRQTRYLRHDGVEPVMILAPPRSGKGVGIIVPTLVSWRESMIVNDLKGELWAMTAGWREQHGGNRCYRLDFSHPDSAKFNILETIRVGSNHEIADAQLIAKMIVDPDGTGFNGRDAHWRKTAFALISGVILYAIHLKARDHQSASLTDVARTLSPASQGFEEVLEDMQGCESLIADGEVARFIAARAREQAERNGEERGSVLSTARSYFSLFDDPIVAANIQRCDFGLDDFLCGDNPISVYFSSSPGDAERLRPIYRLLLTVILRHITRDMTIEEGRSGLNNQHQLLLMLDEFASLKKLDILTETIAYLPGYGVKAVFVLQDLSQLRDTYGREESISASCHIKVAFAPNKVETAKWLSDMTGTTTRIKRQNAKSSKAELIAQDSFSESSRPLMTADEILRLPPAKKNGTDMTEAGDMLIFVSGMYPIYGKQVLYFKDTNMLARTQVTAP